MFFAPRYGEVIGDLYPYMQVPNRTSLSQIRTLSVERIGKFIRKASPEELNQAIEGLNEIIA